MGSGRGWEPGWRSSIVVWLIGHGFNLCLSGLLVFSGSTPARAEQASSSAAASQEDLSFAHALLKERRYDQAAQEYERYLRTKPEQSGEIEARLGLARARLFLNQYQESREQFELFLKLAPEHPAAATALFRIGETAYLSGDLEGARKALERFTTSHPDHAQKDAAWPYLGDVYFGLGDLARAQAAYERALQIAPEGRLADRCRFFRARSLAAQGEVSAAAKAYDELVQKRVPEWSERSAFEAILAFEKEGEAQVVLERASRFEATYGQSKLLPSVRRLKAETLFRAGQVHEAEVIWQDLARTAPREIALNAAERLAQQSLGRNQPAVAREVWIDLGKRFRGLPQVEYRVAESWELEGGWDQAEAGYSRILESNRGSDWESLCRLGLARIALARNDGKRAQALLAEARQAGIPDVNQAEAGLIQAQVFQAAGRLSEAAAELEKLLREAKSAPQVRTLKYQLATVLRSKAETARARTLFEEVEGGARDDLALRSALALGQMDLEEARWKDAESALGRCLNLNPKGETAAQATACLAWAVHQSGDLGRFQELQTKLEADHPESPSGDWLRLRLSETAVMAGDDKHAWEWIAPVLEHDQSPWLKQARLIGGAVKLRLGDARAARDLVLELTRSDAEAKLRDEAKLTQAMAESALGREETALEQLEALTVGTTGDLQLRAELARARIWMRKGQAKEAYSSLERVWETVRDGQTAIKADEVLADLARAAQESDQAERADQAYLQLLERYPDSALAWEARFQLGESAYGKGEWEAARNFYEKVVSPGTLAPGELIEPALYRLGRIEAEGRRWKAAADWFRRQLKDYPGGEFHRVAGMWLGECLYQEIQFEEAEITFRGLLSEPQESHESWLPLARVRHGQCLVKLGKFADAERVLEGMDVTTLDTEMRSEYQLASGECRMARAEFEAARRAFAEVIQNQPRTELAARAQFLRGESYFHEERLDEALREFEKTELLYQAPMLQSAALLESGKLHEKRGAWSRAIAAYEKLIKDFPETPAGREAVSMRDAVKRKIAQGMPEKAPVR